jgi:hypothetical protein
MGTVAMRGRLVRVSVTGPAAGDGRSGHEGLAFEHALDAREVLRRGVHFPALPEEDHDLGARVPLEMDVGRRADVLAPSVLGRGQSFHYVRGRVSVQEADHAERVRLGVGERAVGEFLADQRPDGVRTARAVAFGNPLVE